MEKNSLIPILEQIEKDKGVKKEEILQMIEASLISAYRKQYGRNINVVANVDPETAEMKTWVIKKLVKKTENPNEEISVEQAKQEDLKADAEGNVKIEVKTSEFARIAAQIAKQIIVQKIRETERTNLFEEFLSRERSLANGLVFRFVDRNMIIDLGKAEAILPSNEQVRKEHFNQGERIKVLVLRVQRSNRGPQIVVSRTHPDLLRRLLELEVPEIGEGVVEIIDVVRDAGFRAKVSVKSNNGKVDAVGTCVGMRGSRIRPVIDELRGERIDLIHWSPDVEKYITAALSPAKVLSVHLNAGAKTAEVLVSNDMYSLAIGRAGQNVRLASKLTGWNIDVKSEAQKREQSSQTIEVAQKELAQLEGVGAKTAEVLIKGGWTNIAKLAKASVEQLTSLQGIGEKTAEKVIETAKLALTNQSSEENQPNDNQEND